MRIRLLIMVRNEKFIFVFAIAFMLLCNISVKSQSRDMVEQTQNQETFP
jgi:hypothetical protein